eukprot:g4364.t1
MKALDYSLPYGRPNEGSLVKQDWDDYLHDLHKTRLRHVRAEVKKEMKTPRSLMIRKRMGRNGKKQALMEERYLEIERENRILLNKMSRMMREPAEIKKAMQNSAMTFQPKTLNKKLRQSEFRRINFENVSSAFHLDSCILILTLKVRKERKRNRRKWAHALPPMKHSHDVHPETSNESIAPGGMVFSSSAPAVGFGGSSIMSTEVDLSSGKVLRESRRVRNSKVALEPLPPRQGRQQKKASPSHTIKQQQQPKSTSSKIYEVGMNLKGVFVVVSAIVRGKSLVISAFCPSDQSVSELVLGVPEVQRILKDNPELLSRARREDMCRAIVSKVDFFMRDGDRVLLVDETKNSKVATTEQARKEQRTEEARQLYVNLMPAGPISSPDQASAEVSEAGNNFKESSTADGEASRAVKSESAIVFKACIRMPRHTHGGRRVLITLHDAWLLRVFDTRTNLSWDARLPPVLSQQLQNDSGLPSEMKSILREYIVEEGLVKVKKRRY